MNNYDDIQRVSSDFGTSFVESNRFKFMREIVKQKSNIFIYIQVNSNHSYGT